MRIGIIRTVGSPCRCAESIAEGLRLLGHVPLIYDSEHIESSIREIAETCKLVFDHSDTYRGSGLLRAMVRFLLETHGVPIIGSDSRACLLCDDKAAAMMRLADAGVPVPPGIVVTENNREIPAWLIPPYIVKPVYSHMSRGLLLAGTVDDARVLAGELLARTGEPIRIEMFIPGRELAVSVIEEEGGLRVLAPFEWLPTAGEMYQTESLKATEKYPDRDDCAPARLPQTAMDTLAGLVRLAFRVLGMRHYGRFDIRFSPDGMFYFLEANTTPSFEPAEAFPLSALWSGYRYEVLLERLISSASTGPAGRHLPVTETMNIAVPAGSIIVELPAGVHRVYDSSIELARLLDVVPGDRVLDLGCGSGFLSIVAAKQGAAEVVATDVDARSLKAAADNALRNNVGDRVKIVAGSWYEGLARAAENQGEDDLFDVIVATPPQTPGPYYFGPRCGGPDGLLHFRYIIGGVRRFLAPEKGRLWLLAISLADVPALQALLNEQFSEVTIVQETERPFCREEYENMAGGLFAYLSHRRDSGKSVFYEANDGMYSFRTVYVRASKLK